ncbi:MAG: phosphoglycerate dehydrogenase [Rectinemataceae bacterium]|nr:phosphoglycerate dehydrogenase [Rectinemataceae bacterium]
MKSVIVTPRSLSAGGHPLLEKIRSAGYEVVFPSPGAQPTKDQLAAVLGGAVGWLAGVERIDAGLLAAAKDLKVISRNGTGVDNIDLAAAAMRGITIRRAEGANARGVAELAFGHILSAARRIPQAASALRSGMWTREKGFELEGKTLGLVGCGRIGKTVAKFALAFGMKVLACDPYPDAGFSPVGDFSWARLESVLVNSDVISLHCPPGPGGKPVLDASALDSMKKGVVIVNTARESVVDWPAMKAALDAGRISWYTLDAFDCEPPKDFDIPSHPRVIATPHIGGFTDESIDRATGVAVDNLLSSLAECGA